MQPHARIDRIYVENDDKDRVEEINMKEEVWIEREDQKQIVTEMKERW